MASAITTVSTTLEGQLLEIIESIASVQVVAERNPDSITLVTTYSRNMATGAITFAGAVPTTDALDGTGKIVVGAATVYID
ncbi:hypothetical protein VB834_09240 [Limnoraphis robusta Tam1]|uniref:Uncharacterized protein n=1 Tax=Limnoraphis robusta CCNP1315 TaxID=3110306 RepID=A0ABU5U094_9CYAN|nr:hypothetical protein [Limnoraphis robusta]MEA5500365.1 hypothetical protein [Limnoraphis robusta BA-68 BA1]MEA5519553.1 hypothetical protein [Limnoraphis robusta CCNP1315]MEA5539217.1 hypothetical protein [Limnoraphis robusta Tam1]MEA5545821.1 hypothetical protein [Limnoraphis robusta CCNP1324]